MQRAKGWLERPCPHALTPAPTPPARLQPKGSSFTGENKDFYRFVIGQHSVIPAFEEAVTGMKVRARRGALRSVLVLGVAVANAPVQHMQCWM